MQDAVKRCALVSQHADIRALLVHALHEQAKLFYEHYGYQASAIHLMTLLLRFQQSWAVVDCCQSVLRHISHGGNVKFPDAGDKRYELLANALTACRLKMTTVNVIAKLPSVDFYF